MPEVRDLFFQLSICVLMDCSTWTCLNCLTKQAMTQHIAFQIKHICWPCLQCLSFVTAHVSAFQRQGGHLEERQPAPGQQHLRHGGLLQEDQESQRGAAQVCQRDQGSGSICQGHPTGQTHGPLVAPSHHYLVCLTKGLGSTAKGLWAFDT